MTLQSLRKSAEYIIVLLLLPVLAFLVQFLFARWSSPLYSDNYDFDQSIFYVIGRAWHDGHLPYLTAWDSKGPIIFLANMLGYCIEPNIRGVFWLQCINFLLVLWAAWFCLRRVTTMAKTMVCVLLFSAAYIIISSGGNQVGDYTLALSVFTVFCTYRWSVALQQGGVVSHPVRYAFFYGLFFAACLLSRLTNAMVLSTSIMVIVLVLVWHRRWQNLLANAVAFILGFACCFLPFAFYFYAHGAFGEMWYAMFSYNLEYALHSHPVAFQQIGVPVVYMMFYFISLLAIPIWALAEIVAKRKGKVILWVWLAITLPVLVWLSKSYANANYVISYLPVLFVPVLQLMDRVCEIGVDREKTKALLIRRWALASIVLIVIGGFANYVRVFRSYGQEGLPLQEAQRQMAALIPDNATMVAYNCMPSVYIYNQKLPACRFFVCQDWAIENGASLREKVRNDYEETMAEWVMVSDINHCAVRDILMRRYRVVKVDKVNDLMLMKRLK